MEQPGKHVPCPVHGGKDGFRLFSNYQENGACVCNTCGEFRDGFKTLEWINGWSFFEALKHVAALLGFGNSASKLIRTEPIKKKFVGTILRMGSHNDSGKETFIVALKHVAALLGFGNSASKLIRTEPIKKKFVGTILRMGSHNDSGKETFIVELCEEDHNQQVQKLRGKGLGKETFIVELCEEDHNQQVQKLRGKGLQKACAIAGVKEGDRVCLTLFSKQTYQSVSWTFHTYHWGAERLPSLEDEERVQQKQRSEDIRRDNAIVSTWENAKRFSWKDPEGVPLAKYFLSRCLKVTDQELVEDLRFSPKRS